MSAFRNSVAIGPEFFKKSLRDYSDPFWAFARELLQNSLDCLSREIHVRVAEDREAGTTTVVVRNDGATMSREVLVGKLLALGGSGKDFQDGAVGGFGRAKELLYFAHRSYRIQTGPFLVEGSGAGYDLAHTDHYLHGTRSVVTWEGLVGEKLLTQFGRFARMVDRPCRIYIEEERVESRLKGARFRRTLEHDGQAWADVKTHGGETGLVVVRIGGTPMFTQRSDHKKTVIVELKGTSVERLTSNRDGLKHPYGSRLVDFITELSIDRKSALRDQEPMYHHHAGRRLHIAEIVRKALAVVSAQPTAAAAMIDREFPAHQPTPGTRPIAGRETRPGSVLDVNFVVKNCVRKPVPREYDPGDIHFSEYAHWLVRSWSALLLELHRAFQVDRQFSIGFILSPELYGEFENGDYGPTYFLNPIIIGPRSHRRRWMKSRKHELAAAAAHEFCHGAFERHYHNEDFASDLTRVMGEMLGRWHFYKRLMK